MKKIVYSFAVIILAAFGLTLPTAAYAGGSDSPTPYIVDQTGITLPAGDTFRDNGHVNINSQPGGTNLHFEGKCINRTDAECAGARHDAAQFIGKSFIPWSAFGLSGDFCVSWVQISHYNEHFGEGGQAPVCVTKDKPKPPQPQDDVVFSEWVDGEWACGDTEVTQTRTKTVTPYIWDANTWTWIAGQSTVTTEQQTRALTPDEVKNWQTANPDGECFNRPPQPEPKSGVEQRVTEPVCVAPLNGRSTTSHEERSWTQEAIWNEAEQRYVDAEKVYGEWIAVSTETADDENCAPVVVPPKDTPKKPAPKPEPVLALTGSSNLAFAGLGGLALILAGAVAFALRVRGNTYSK